MAKELLKQVLSANLFVVKSIGCDASFGSDHDFLKSLPGENDYFAVVRKNEKIFRTMPEMVASSRADAVREERNLLCKESKRQ